MESISTYFTSILLYKTPNAVAQIMGNRNYQELNGVARFYETAFPGILMELTLFGLPTKNEEHTFEFFGLHIHEIGNCQLPFNQTGEHYSKEMRKHPMHSGDLPPVIAQEGYSFMSFFLPQLTIEEVMNRSIIVHRNPDDFTTQPSGDSGEKIGCGVIRAV